MDFDEEWERTEVRVVSPNEQVFLTIRGDHEVQVAFAPGHCERTSRSQLEQQLGRTGRIALVERTRAFFELRSRESGRTVVPGRSVVTRANAEYYERLDELAVEGRSSDDAVSVTAIGMTRFSVRIAPGALERLDGTALGHRASEAATALLHDQMRKVAELKSEVYYV